MSSSDPGRWLLLATSDASAARRLLTPPAALHQAAYLAQQAAEKITKARLAVLQIAYPRHGARGHDLVALSGLLPESDPMKPLLSELSAITPWATAFRYPSDDPSTEELLTAQQIEHRLGQIETAARLLTDLLRR